MFCAWSLYVYETLINIEIFDLIHRSASIFCLYGLFCFDKLCLLFCILFFTVFVWFSLLHKTSVAVEEETITSYA